mgnify:CR=1 FL=1
MIYPRVGLALALAHPAAFFARSFAVCRLQQQEDCYLWLTARHC